MPIKYRKGVILLLVSWFVAWTIVGGIGFRLEFGPTVRDVHLAKHMRHAAFACVLLLPLGATVLYFLTRWIRRFRS